MSIAPFLVTVAESSSSHGVNPYIIGGGVLFVFFLLMSALLAFGRGRDHS
jgi:hypothetical protein